MWQWYARYHPSMPVSKVFQFASHNKISKEVLAAYDAPYPSKKYKDGARAFPSLIPSSPSDPGVDRMNKARKVLSNWKKPALILFSDKDRVMSGLEEFFYKLIPTANNQPRITIQDAGHFLQEEKGEEIANHIKTFIIQSLQNSSNQNN